MPNHSDGAGPFQQNCEAGARGSERPSPFLGQGYEFTFAKDDGFPSLDEPPPFARGTGDDNGDENEEHGRKRDIEPGVEQLALPHFDVRGRAARCELGFEFVDGREESRGLR
jgi:hypothetical protein